MKKKGGRVRLASKSAYRANGHPNVTPIRPEKESSGKASLRAAAQSRAWPRLCPVEEVCLSHLKFHLPKRKPCGRWLRLSRVPPVPPGSYQLGKCNQNEAGLRSDSTPALHDEKTCQRASYMSRSPTCPATFCSTDLRAEGDIRLSTCEGDIPDCDSPAWTLFKAAGRKQIFACPAASVTAWDRRKPGRFYRRKQKCTVLGTSTRNLSGKP